MDVQQVVSICQEKLSTDHSGEARRLFHGRGHMYPGLEHVVVSWYPPYLHIALYAETADTEIARLVEDMVNMIEQMSHPEATAGALQGVAVQYRAGRRTETKVFWGEVPDEVLVSEDSLQYWIQPLRNQNVGLFLDMGHVRQYLSSQMLDANVLNLFSYTCAFSVSAIKYGAKSVVNNDMSRNALELGERNHAANTQDLRKVRMIPHNLFKSWWKIKQFGPYDVIIIDPPTNQRGSFVAEKSYGQVLKRIPELASPGARIIACLNSPFLGPDFITQQMQRWCPECHFEEQLPAHPDFPDRYPERGLKVAVFKYLRNL